MTRHFIFKNYSWLGVLLGGLAIAAAFTFGGDRSTDYVGTAIAGTLGFFYFVQQQRLAETQLFHALFTAFNARYDKLNGALALLAAQPSEPLSGCDRNVIIDYFNLCAEEYLFYREGYIKRDVWRSWCRGMLWYLKRKPFIDVWNDEVKTESFYGLSIVVIERGAV